ncbi:hypothetical protein K0P33_05275 [Pseudomonas sp. ArH3a]|uniref:hypothetical protein n=1 Tax=Pseudomonas sp. ArH3a TaxID=2862945 RepID=UPI001F57A8CE|nr:hypothetical protein [Pseudomonas sp. ArH3a]UNM20872.1 hypothetical protein K0P33_05275 [Pseudomonas sp. ArH3a]
MTTNQTIDGVPRELLERIATEANHMLGFTYAANYDECRTAVDELRALLDAPVKSFAQTASESAYCQKVPSAKPLGDPVAPFGYWLSPKDQPALGRFHRVTSDDAIIDSDSVVSYFDITALYAEKPAPVAVVLPERTLFEAAYERGDFYVEERRQSVIYQDYRKHQAWTVWQVRARLNTK